MEKLLVIVTAFLSGLFFGVMFFVNEGRDIRFTFLCLFISIAYLILAILVLKSI